MSQSEKKARLYTTGEIAKLSGVSVRTVQYYDGRGILIPSELSEGGRRLYTENDLKRMRVICFLRGIGFPINSIALLFREKDPENIISVLLDEQETVLREELSDCRKKLDMIDGMKREIKEMESLSVESIGDIAHVMKEKNKLTKMRTIMILTGIPVTLLQCTSIVLWITNGLWWLFAVWACVALPWGITISRYYFNHVAYICPECHDVFKPTSREALWAYHTPRMRRLTCHKCGRRGLCVEIFDDGTEKGVKENA
ncbi:MAG: MerR family transcriptional regulator [Ruminococcaceae bacterium]|nr:MerR family transcriptional regulator [Oscillospiraceae bacterium]